MKDIRAKVAYLYGLAEGLDVDASVPEGRILNSMMEVLDDLTEKVGSISQTQDALSEYVDEIDEDLDFLEMSLYGDERVCFVADGDDMGEMDAHEECPDCGMTLTFENDPDHE